VRSPRRTEYRRPEGGPPLADPAFPAGVIHGGQHRHVGVEADEQRRRLFVMFDDQRGPAFFQRFEYRVQVTGKFRGGNHFEHDATVDTHSSVVKRGLILLTIVAAGCPHGLISPSPRPSLTPSALSRCPAGSPAPAG